MTDCYYEHCCCKKISDFFIKLADVDGLWIDMNECANFCDGFCATAPEARSGSAGKFDPRRPPYNINNRCSTQPLSTRTLPVEATYYGGITDYNAHNLFGEYVILWPPQVTEYY